MSKRNDAPRLRAWRANPREVADIICGEGEIVDLPLHAHDALQVMLPASRCVVLDGRQNAVVVNPGQVHVTAPLALYGARTLDEGPCPIRLLMLTPAALSRLGGELARPRNGTAPTPPQRVVDDPRLYAELWTLIGALCAPVVTEMRDPRLVLALGKLLDAHVDDDVSLAALAPGLSEFYLLRAFHRAYGVTPHAYRMQRRSARARHGAPRYRNHGQEEWSCPPHTESCDERRASRRDPAT